MPIKQATQNQSTNFRFDFICDSLNAAGVTPPPPAYLVGNRTPAVGAGIVQAFPLGNTIGVFLVAESLNRSCLQGDVRDGASNQGQL